MTFLPPPRPAGASSAILIRRPSTLTLGFAGALVVGLSSLVAGVLLVSEARHLAEQTAADLLSGEGLAGVGLNSGAVDQATDALTTRGVTVLVSGALVLGVAFAVRDGATWARSVLGLLLLGTVCG